MGQGLPSPLSAWTRALLIPNRSCSLFSKRETSGEFPSNTNSVWFSIFRVFVDILAEDSVDVNKQYPLENHQTILQVCFFFLQFPFPFHIIVIFQLAVEAEATEFVSELLRHPRTDPNLPDQVTLSNWAHVLISQKSSLKHVHSSHSQFDINPR